MIPFKKLVRIFVVEADPPGSPSLEPNPSDQKGYRVWDNPIKAPIANGASILLNLGLAYWYYMIYRMEKANFQTGLRI